MRRAASRLSGGRRPRRPGARIARVLRATQLLIAVILRRSPRDGRRIPALPLVAPLARTAKFARARRAASCLFGGPASPPATCSHRPRSPCDATLDRCHPSSVAALPLVAPLARTATFARMRRAASQGGSTGLQAGECKKNESGALAPAYFVYTDLVALTTISAAPGNFSIAIIAVRAMPGNSSIFLNRRAFRNAPSNAA
jgi:hypothetical protein